MVLKPIFLMSKLRLAQALWFARGRVVVGSCSVQRPCPFQPVDSSSGEAKNGSPRKGCLWGGFQALPTSKLKQPVTLGGGAKGRMDWTLSIVLYCLANAPLLTIQLNLAEKQVNLPSPQQKSNSKTIVEIGKVIHAEGLRKLPSFPSQRRAPRHSSFPSSGSLPRCPRALALQSMALVLPGSYVEVYVSAAHRRSRKAWHTGEPLEESVLKE